MTSVPLPQILPPGTQVVAHLSTIDDDGHTRPGKSMATVVMLASGGEVPLDDQQYVVRFVDGGTARLARRDFEVRRRALEMAVRARPAGADSDLWKRVVLRSV